MPVSSICQLVLLWPLFLIPPPIRTQKCAKRLIFSKLQNLGHFQPTKYFQPLFHMTSYSMPNVNLMLRALSNVRTTDSYKLVPYPIWKLSSVLKSSLSSCATSIYATIICKRHLYSFRVKKSRRRQCMLFMFYPLAKHSIAKADQYMLYIFSRFKRYCQAHLCSLLQCLCVHLTRNSDQRFWPPLMLQKCCHLAMTVQSCLHCCQNIQLIQTTHSERVLILWNLVHNLSCNCCPWHWAHRVQVGGLQCVTLVSPTNVATNNLSISKASSPKVSRCVHFLRKIWENQKFWAEVTTKTW